MSEISGAPLAGDTNAAEKSVPGSNPSEKQPHCVSCTRVAKVAGRFCNVCFVECLYRAVKKIEEEVSSDGAMRSRAVTMPNAKTTKPDIKLVRRKTMLVLHSTDSDLKDEEEPVQSLSERKLKFIEGAIKDAYTDGKMLWDEVFIPIHDGTPLTPLTEIQKLEECLGIGIENQLKEPGSFTKRLNERVEELRKRKVDVDREAFQERAGGTVRWLFQLCNEDADYPEVPNDAGNDDEESNDEESNHEESNDEESNGEAGSPKPTAVKRSRSNEEENQSEADGSKPVEEVKKTEEEVMESVDDVKKTEEEVMESVDEVKKTEEKAKESGPTGKQ